MKKIVLNKEPDYRAKKEAFDFQTKAFEFCKNLEYAGIFLEQGLGKTKIAIDLILFWLDQTDIDTVLILTKKNLINNWKKELSFHSNLKPRILNNNRENNFNIYNSPCRVVLANFELLLSNKERLAMFSRCRNVAIIVDESAKIKNPDSKITQNIFALAQYFKRRVIMSGTPVANRPYDIWAQVYFLDGGKSLGEDYEQFRSNTDLPKNRQIRPDDYAKNLDEIFQKIDSFCIRETKSSANLLLPEKNYHEIWCTFTSDQYKMYCQIRDEAKLAFQKDGELIVDDAAQALKRILRLMQVTSNPRILDKESGVLSGKEIRLDSLLKDIMARDEKVIIWSNFVENVDYFYEKYHEKYGAVKFYGKMSIEERNRSVEEFTNGPAKVFIATPQSAKEGLTLTSANNAIFYDRGFSLDEYLQAQDRIHRISQNKPCNIYLIMIKGSIDEWVNELLRAKNTAASLMQSDISKDEFNESMKYSYRDILQKILDAAKEAPNGRE